MFIVRLMVMWMFLNGCAYVNYQEASPLRQEGMNEETISAIVLTVIEELTKQGIHGEINIADH